MPKKTTNAEPEQRKGASACNIWCESNGHTLIRQPRKPLFVCAGTQSSGSTLVSWCFLQRADMNGVLDARNDLLAPVPAVSETRVDAR